ncbi:MAG: hypothetical protein PVI03_04650 [Candidatus Thorarchaeota archaeon]
MDVKKDPIFWVMLIAIIIMAILYVYFLLQIPPSEWGTLLNP